MRHPELVLVLVALFFGCASDPTEEYRGAYQRGDYKSAGEVLTEAVKDFQRDAHLYEMELGVVELAERAPPQSVRALRRARNRLDELGGQDLTSWIGTAFTDDRSRVYEGADYEHVLVRAMLAIADLMDSGQDANAYALQVQERQIEIRESFEDDKGLNPKDNYRLVAFGSYLSGMLNEDSPTKLDAARRAYQSVQDLAPEYPMARRDLERVTNGQHSRKGNGVVHVIALVGRGPFRVESEAPVAGGALAIAQVFWQISRKGVVLPTITKVKIPALAFHNSNPGDVSVHIDGKRVGATLTITDVNEMAREEFAALHDHIVARAVMRRAFKIVATEGVRAAAVPKGNQSGSKALLDLGISVLSNLWTAAEKADLRCWSLLPAAFQVLRVELPVGDHEITFRARSKGNEVGAPQSIDVSVRDGRNTYVVVMAPTLSGGPPPLSSDSLEPARIDS